jgi:hypothetical protein
MEDRVKIWDMMIRIPKIWSYFLSQDYLTTLNKVLLIFISGNSIRLDLLNEKSMPSLKPELISEKK